MNPWSLKKSGFFLSIIVAVSFFSPLSSSLHIQKAAAADATPVGTSVTAVGYEGDFIIPDFYNAVVAYPGTAFPSDLTTTGTAAGPLPQGVLETYSLTENTGTALTFQVVSKPTTTDDGYDAADDEFGQVGIAAYIKKSTEGDDKYLRINNGAEPYFFTGENDADETPITGIIASGLYPGTTYTVKFVGVYYYDTVDVDDGHIVPVTFTVTTAAAGEDEEAVTPTGYLKTALGYEGNISGGVSNGALSGPIGTAYPHTTLPTEFTAAPTLESDTCAEDNGVPDADVVRSCEGAKVDYSLEDVTATSFKIKYVATPTTVDPDAEEASDLKELYFWTYIKKAGTDDTTYTRLSSGGHPYFTYDYTPGGEGTATIEIGTLLTGTKYTVKILGIYKYNEFSVNDGHILPAEFDVTTDAAASEAEAAAAAAAAAGGPTATYASANIDVYCLDLTRSPQLSLAGCTALFLKNAIFPLIAGIIYIVGKFFDIMANFSIGSEAYGSAVTFIQAGWTLVRDFSNILFIVALVYLAFGIIFDLHGINVKKSIASLIVMALLVNFSLFFTKVIIDASNILARIFYTQIDVSGLDDLELTSSSLPTVNISRGLISSFDPQQMIGPDTQLLLQAQLSKGADQNRMMLILYFMACVMLVIAGWAFLVTGLNFVQRTISLWLAMIFSPFAFVSYAFPFGLKHLKRIGWDAWIKDLLCWCFYAPLFLFFIYIIIAFASSDFLQGFVANASSYGIFEFLVYLIFPFIVIITLLIYAKNLAKSLGCEGADALVGAGTKLAAGAVGVGMMVASGGASAIMRRTAGASAANRLEKDDVLKKAAAGDTKALADIKARKNYAGLSEVAAQKKAEEEVKRLQKRSTNSYDFRQTKAANAISGALGINMNAGSSIANTLTKGKIGFGTAETSGGYMGEIDRRVKERQDFIKSLGIDHHEVDHQDGIIKKNKEGDSSSTDPNKQKSFADIKDERDKLLAAQAKAKANSTKLSQKDQDDLENLQIEASRRNKEIEKAETAKAKAEKGYTKTYAEFLERNKDYNKRPAETGQDAAASLTRPTMSRGIRGLKQALGGFVAGTIALGPLGSVMGTLAGAINGLSDGGVLKSMNAMFRNSWLYSGLESGKNVFSALGSKDKNSKGVEVDKFKADISGSKMAENIAASLKDSHYHPGTYKDTYKPAMKEFFKFFENLSKGGIEIKGGGGGKHSDGHGEKHEGGHGGAHH